MHKLIMFTLCFAINVGIGSAQTAGDFKIHLSPQQQTVAPNDSIVVYVTLTNISDHEIDVPMAASSKIAWADYVIHVTRTDGVPVPETTYGKTAKPNRYLGPQMGTTLKPGGTISEQTLINKLFDMSKPGEYHIVLDRSASPTENIGRITSDVAVVVVAQ